MAGMDANLTVAQARAQQERTCCNDHQGKGGTSNSGAKASKSMKKMEHESKEKEG